MKSFTLTPSTPTRRIYIYKQYCSIKIEGSDFANTQLIVEQRDNDGRWTSCSIPSINTDQDWFTITSATRRRRMRFSVVGSGAYSIPIQVKQSTDAEYNFLTTVNDPNAAGDHSHSNLAVLDATTEAFTSTELNNINDNTANNHTHANKTVLDATTEAFTSHDLNNINYNTANNHTHANKTILDATTANFTTAAALKLDDIEAEATKGGTKQDDTTNAIIPKLDTKSGSVAGNARGNEAVDTQIIRTAATQVASGARSVILGGSNNTASNTQAAVVSSSGSTASGSGAVVVGGDNNTSSGVNSEILGSQNSTASGTGSSVIGSDNCNVSGNWGIAAGGINHQITQARSGIFAGNDNTVNHTNSVILGGSNITSDAADTAFVPNLNVGGGFKMPTGATDTYVLTSDANGVGTWQVAGGGGGSSIVASYTDKNVTITKPTSASVIVPITGMAYQMQAGVTYYVKMFVMQEDAVGNGNQETLFLSHTPWAATAGVKTGFIGKNWSDAGLTGGYLYSGRTQYTGSWYEASASTMDTSFFSAYSGFVSIEGFITAPSTATFTPQISYVSTTTGSSVCEFQGMIMEMP
jgi:hypothetical protein